MRQRRVKYPYALSFRVDETLYQHTQIAADQKGLDVSEVLREALEKYVRPKQSKAMET